MIVSSDLYYRFVALCCDCCVLSVGVGCGLVPCYVILPCAGTVCIKQTVAETDVYQV